MDTLLFKDLLLSSELQRAIKEMGFEEATPIQSKAIPAIIDGNDVIGQAQTGTGKTCAFGIPIAEIIDPDESKIQALILSPTRELAIQSCEEIKQLLKYKHGLKVIPIYGGQPIDRQILSLKKKPQIIVGTPGRIMDHMRRKTIRLDNLKIIVLDEADEMLNMGFREDIDTILEKVPNEHQTVLFSATMSKEIKAITKKYQKDPVHIEIVHKELTVPSIDQYYIETRESAKVELLSRLIDATEPRLSLVFCNTKKRADDLSSSLQLRDYQCEALHGDLSQAARDRVMKKFRNGSIDILIATDVAARGIDVDDVDAVFNYDLPGDEEYYVHRIGRTGRAGRMGKSYSFIVGREMYKLKDIMRYTKSKIHQMKPPSIKDVETTKINSILKNIKDNYINDDFSKYTVLVDSMLNELNATLPSEDCFTSVDFAAVLLKLITQQSMQSTCPDEDLEVVYEPRKNSSIKGGRDNRSNRQGRQGQGRQSRQKSDSKKHDFKNKSNKKKSHDYNPKFKKK